MNEIFLQGNVLMNKCPMFFFLCYSNVSSSCFSGGNERTKKKLELHLQETKFYIYILVEFFPNQKKNVIVYQLHISLHTKTIFKTESECMKR